MPTPRVSARIRRTSPRQGPRPPLQLVERMVVMVIGVVQAYEDRLLRALEPLLQERFGRQDSAQRQDRIERGEVFERVQEGQVSKGFLERMFHMVDHVAANDLQHAVDSQRVVPVPLADLMPRAAEMQSAWITRNTELIQLEERARKEIAAIVEAPIQQGVRVEEIRAQIQERMGVVRSRAELIARDQTLKLYGQIQEERQTDAGIEEYVWSTSEDERVRHRHSDLEGTTQRWDSPPIVDLKSGRREHPGGDFQCLPASARVGFSGPVNGAFRRRYAGELTELVTATGETLECTPNHPILTATGWQPAQNIQVGDDVVATREHGAQLPEAHVQGGQPSVAEVFETLALALGANRPSAVTTQFHGDASVDDHVDVVDVDRGLRLDLEPALSKLLGELGLPIADPPGFGLRKADLLLERLGLAAAGGVGALRLRLAQFFGRLGKTCEVSGPAIARLHTITDQQITDGLALGPVALGQAFDGRSGGLQLQAFLLGQWLRIVRRSVQASGGVAISDRELADRLLMAADVGANVAPGQAFSAQRVSVVKTNRRQFSGHVFNLSTDGNWYAAQGILTHNCRCAAIPVLPTGDDAPISETRPSVRPGQLQPVPPANDVPDVPVSKPEPDAVELERQRLAEQRAAREAERERLAAAERAAEAERQRQLEAQRVEAARLAEARLVEAEKARLATELERSAREEQQQRAMTASNTIQHYAERLQFGVSATPGAAGPTGAWAVPLEVAAKALEKVGLRHVGILKVAPDIGSKTAEGLYFPGTRDLLVMSEGLSALGEALPDAPGPRKVFSMGTHPSTQAEALRNTGIPELGHHAHMHANQNFSPGSGSVEQRAAAVKVAKIVDGRWKAADREYLTDYAQHPKTLPIYRSSEYFAEAFAAYHAAPEWLQRVAPKAHRMVRDVLKLRKDTQ